MKHANLTILIEKLFKLDGERRETSQLTPTSGE